MRSPLVGDINGDGSLNAFDVDRFVTLLTGGAPVSAEQLAPLLVLRPASPEDDGGFRSVGCNFTASGLEITWTSKPGRFYVVEYSMTARPGSWLPVNGELVLANEGNTTAVDSDEGHLSAFKSFYRVRMLP